MMKLVSLEIHIGVDSAANYFKLVNFPDIIVLQTTKGNPMDNDAIVYEFKLTFGDLIDIVNYMNDEDEIEELTQEQLSDLNAYLGDAVTDALSQWCEDLRLGLCG